MHYSDTHTWITHSGDLSACRSADYQHFHSEALQVWVSL
jgi:hypothetical protein